MKKLNASHTISNILLTVLLTASGIGCIVTAFDLVVDPQAVLGTIVIWSVLTCLCFSRIWSMLLLVAVLLLSMAQLSYMGLAPHLESFLWNVSTLYNQAYELGFTIWWTSSNHLGADTTCFFQLQAIATALMIGAGLTQQRIWPGILMGIGMLAPCVVVTNTAPDSVFLFLWLLSLLLLAISALARRETPNQAAQFLAKVFLPILLSLAIVFAAIPQDSYVAPESTWLIDFVEHLIEKHQSSQPTEPGQSVVLPTSPISVDVTAKSINLANVGPKKYSVSRKLSLLTDYSGYAYLRRMEYAVYTGSSWYVQEGTSRVDMDAAFLSNTRQTSYISYETDIRLLPYYSLGVEFTNGCLPAEDGVLEFTEVSYPLIDRWAEVWEANFGEEHTLSALPQILERDPELVPYTALPSNTRKGAGEILETIDYTSSESILSAVQKIGDFVRFSAEYSLQTSRMPAGETDFALWFLRSSDRGYCVHFATAATVLLRAAGIPARYVEGYLAETVAGKSQYVLGGQAHAWVEYYLPGAGWVILEATPGAIGPTPPPTEPPTAPPTEPTTIPTEPTEPSTVPSKPTEPTTMPTEPTEPVVTPGPGRDLSGLWAALKYLGWIFGCLGILVGQWRLRLYWLRRRLQQGTPNRQALARWQHIKWLFKLEGTAPPEDLLALAKKAKFSQHTITEEELASMEAYRQDRIARMKKKNIFLQAFYRFILALY